MGTVRERFLSDLRCGAYHPYRELPSQQALSQIYGIAPRRMSILLEELVESGIVVRRGRRHALAAAHPAATRSTVLVVSRCDGTGKLLFDSERETEFIKSIQREGRRQDLRIVIAGWHEEPHRESFLDQRGLELRPEILPGILLGTIASTWLVREPRRLLKRLWELKVPVSAWWEHPRDLFPRRGSGHPSTVGFNLSFGSSPGIAVGHHLRQLGYREIAFISPFHASEWSRLRLEGLREALAGSTASISTFVDTEHANAWEFHQETGSIDKGERRIGTILGGFLDRPDLLRHTAWVAVNDHTALKLLELLRERNLPRPYVVSFDNSSICDAFQIDSFEFHTEGMVRQMLYHLLHPGAKLFREGGLHEMVGRMVDRN